MSKYDQLTQLKSLLDAGVLTQAEFDVEKRKILEAHEETMIQENAECNPYFFSQETIQQRQQAFDRLPEHEQKVRSGAFIGGSIAFGIIFLIFFTIIIFLAMLFGWDGVGEALQNLFGLYKSEY